MAQCQQCHQEIADGLSHCPQCGAEQAAPQEAPKRTVFGYAANPAELLGHAQENAGAAAAATPVGAPSAAAAGAAPAPLPFAVPAPAAATPAAARAPSPFAAPSAAATPAAAPAPSPFAAPSAAATPAAAPAPSPLGGSAAGEPPAGAPPAVAPKKTKKKGGALWLVFIIIAMVLGTGAAITGVYGLVETRPNYQYARACYLGGGYGCSRQTGLGRILMPLFYRIDKSALTVQSMVGLVVGLLGLVLSVLGLLIGKRKLAIAPIAINAIAFIVALVVFPW